MLEEASELLENSVGVGGGGGVSIAPANLKNEEGGGGGSVSGEFGEEERVRGEEGDRNSGGNRWPREETLALLKIRSDMDVAFRDSTLKSLLWDDVSRKLAELGFHRNAKKCKEKFENIYKYHKRTKEGRSGRQNGKNYRFFEQLELFGNHSSLPSPSQDKVHMAPTEIPMPIPIIKPTNVSQDVAPCLAQNPMAEFISTSTSTTSSSGKDYEEMGKKKRKLEDYFEKLMKKVLEKQENLHNKFIEVIEKCEKDRIEREEMWKMQELARMKKEQERVAHERAVASAKDAAVIAFLQKISEQASPSTVQLPEYPIQIGKVFEKGENGVGENVIQGSSSRWPKAEIEALIRLKTNLDVQYQDNGPKGPLWEEISLGMKKIGYDRSAKRCKEKWENMNKYFKRVRESNKKRPEDSKTCPYFHLLESLCELKSNKKVDNSNSENSNYIMKNDGVVVENVDQDQGDEGDEEEDEDEDEDDDNGDDYQIVANNTSSVATVK